MAAVLVGDAVGYSRLMGIDEAATHRRVMADLNQVFVPEVAAHHGRIVKTTGDGFFAEFVSVVDALQCAAAVQGQMAQRNAALPMDRRLDYRMGINLGDIIVEDNDIYGDDVNIAVRLEHLAEPGGISVSGNVVRHVRGKLNLTFEDLGEVTVKNIVDPVHVFRVRMPPAHGDNRQVAQQQSKSPEQVATGARLQSSAVSTRPAIVVLPFDNLSQDVQQEYFCDGLTTDITTDLSKFSNLLVIAANSAFAYKGRHDNVQAIGRDLGVQYVLEGSVQRAGDRIRINVQLIDAVRAHHVWAERFDRRASELFELQDELIELIVTALAIKVTVVESERALRKHPDSLNAYEAFLKGQHLYSTENAATLGRSQEAFEYAARLDPSYARAWAAQAYNMVQGWLQGWQDSDRLAAAEEYALKAVQLDPNDYFNHSYLGFYYLNMGWFDRAIEEYERACALNRNDADLLVDMSEAMVCVGRFAEAVENVRQAMVRNPHVPNWYRWDLGWGLYFLKNYDQAIIELERIIRPHNHVRLLLAASYARQGDHNRAAEVLGQFLSIEPAWSVTKERQSIAFKHPADLAHWLDGVRLAGLPENFEAGVDAVPEQSEEKET